ncbi:hypothetical protein LY76DRAFT_512297, partial [Colletotrichum caudatum]
AGIPLALSSGQTSQASQPTPPTGERERVKIKMKEKRGWPTVPTQASRVESALEPTPQQKARFNKVCLFQHVTPALLSFQMPTPMLPCPS